MNSKIMKKIISILVMAIMILTNWNYNICSFAASQKLVITDSQITASSENIDVSNPTNPMFSRLKSCLVDGFNPETWWCSSSETNPYIIIDLTKEMNIEKIKIYTAEEGQDEIIISGSNDGVGYSAPLWTQNIGPKTNEATYITYTANLNSTYRYFKLDFTAKPSMDVTIDEIEVYGEDVSDSTYAVTYDGNGNTGGAVPTDGSSPYLENATVTVKGNNGSLVKTGNTFTGWNTAANGTGTPYAENATFPMPSSAVTLYAQWSANPTYVVTYDGNGSTGGSVPTDGNSYLSGRTRKVLSKLG